MGDITRVKRAQGGSRCQEREDIASDSLLRAPLPNGTIIIYESGVCFVDKFDDRGRAPVRSCRGIDSLFLFFFFIDGILPSCVAVTLVIQGVFALCDVV